MNKKDDFELNFAKLFWALWKCLPIILLVSAITAGIAYNSFRTPVTTKYIGKVTFLVPKEFSVSNTQIEYETEPNPKNYSNETIKEIVLSSTSVDTYCFVAVAPTTCDIIASRAELSYTGEKLSRMVTAAQEKTNTYTFAVKVTTSDKEESLKIAKAFADYLPEVISEVSSNQTLRVLNPGSVSKQTTGGANVKKTAIYTVIAAVLTCCVIALVYLIKEYTGENRVLSSDVQRLYPERKKLSVFSSRGKAEAIKRLRTNLLLSLPDSEKCRMIGLTAAHPDPAKDDIALGLSRSLAEMGDRVLLIDADLRSHRLQDLLKLKPDAGLSELVRKNEAGGSAVQLIQEDGFSYSFLSAGDGAAAASELLDRRKLLPVLHDLQTSYDYILFDLEAIGSSVDAASVGKELDGVVVAFRDERCTRNQLTGCMTQLEYAAANVLGFVEIKRNALK